VTESAGKVAGSLGGEGRYDGQEDGDALEAAAGERTLISRPIERT